MIHLQLFWVQCPFSLYSLLFYSIALFLWTCDILSWGHKHLTYFSIPLMKRHSITNMFFKSMCSYHGIWAKLWCPNHASGIWGRRLTQTKMESSFTVWKLKWMLWLQYMFRVVSWACGNSMWPSLLLAMYLQMAPCSELVLWFRREAQMSCMQSIHLKFFIGSPLW